MKLEANSPPFIMPNYDDDSFDAVLKAALALSPQVPDTVATFGSKDEVQAVRQFPGTALGFGGLPEKEAFHLNVDPGLPVST